MGRGRVEESPDDGAAVCKAVAGNCASASSGDSIAEDLDAFYAGMKDAARKLREGPNTQPLVDERPRRHAEMRGEDDHNQSGAGSVKYVHPQNRVVHECNAVVEEPVEREPASNIVELREEFGNLCLIGKMEEDVHHGTDLLHLGKAEAETVENLIMAYKPVKKRISPVEMKILLTDDNPGYERPRRMSYADRKIVDDQVADWLAEGIIQVSNSNYASPVVLVGKKDGSKRLCCDYRRLNDKIVRDNFPMPMIDDVIEQLLGANVFSTLNLANEFFHVPVEVSSRKYTSFVTHNGQYEFRYVPFGISNSPAVFSRFVFAVLKDLIQNGTVIAYMDDLIIPSKDELEGIKKLMLGLKRSEASGLQVNWKKCQFLKRRVEFLGYIIANNTIQPSDAEREEVRRQARENIVVIQEENRRTFNANRRTEPEYAIDELVAIKRTQYGVGLKLKPKYLGPYKIVKKMRRGRYTVEKIGDHEGPGRTTTVAEFMKRWDPSFGPNERAGWPNVGNDGHDEQTQ